MEAAADCEGWKARAFSKVCVFEFFVIIFWAMLTPLLRTSDAGRLWRDYRLYKVSEVGNVTCVSSCRDDMPLSTLRISSESALRLERSSCPSDAVASDAKKQRFT